MLNGNQSTLARHQTSQASGARPIPQALRSIPVTPSKILHAGEHLFYAGEQGQNAYLIRSGNLKSYTVYEDGEEQILGLYGRGDILGFDAVLGKTAMCSAVALDTAHVQLLPNPAPGAGNEDESDATLTVLHGMHQELLRLTRMLHIDRHPADRRLAEYLLDYSDRQSRRGLSRDDLMLPVSRRDLACHLGLAPETLSRTLSAFQASRILAIDNRRITITDREALKIIAGV